MSLEKKKITKKQLKFLELYLDPQSKSFANAYQSAIAAGFKPNYARIITNNSGAEWIKEAKKQMTVYEPEHIYRAFQDIAKNKEAYDRDKLKALELMGKARGMFIDRQQSDVTVKFVNDVPRPESERKVVDVSDD